VCQTDTLYTTKLHTVHFVGNAVTLSRQYDPRMGPLIGLSAILSNGSWVQDLQYWYNALGSLVSRRDLVAGLSEEVKYDALNRVQTASINRGQYVKSYTYDPLGNILFKSDFGSYRYDPNTLMGWPKSNG